MVKSEVKTNEIEKRESIKKNNEIKSWFFGKITEINNPVARLTEKKKEKTQITHNRNEKKDVIMISWTLKGLIKEYNGKKKNTMSNSMTTSLIT